ncbi:hypothetical protein ACLB1G_01575 [Oxalobacteraceae bacterium A2-2]
MNRLHSTAYALRRQKIATERVLVSSTPEECQRAARWARAWERLVQRNLELAAAHALQQRYLH